MLRVTDLGLGAVWCGVYPQKRGEENVRECLGLEEYLIPLNVIFIGHPAEEPEARDQYDESRIHMTDKLLMKNVIKTRNTQLFVI